MSKKTTETQKLANKDSAIEIMGAMRSSRISRLALEKAKPESERDEKLIEKLKKELSLLQEERHLMYKGDEKTEEKVLSAYSAEVNDYLKSRNNER